MNNSIVKLNVPSIKAAFDYSCSERALASYIQFKTNGEITFTPKDYNKMGCDSIFTISKCLTKYMSLYNKKKTEYVLIKSNITFKTQYLNIDKWRNVIRYCIDQSEPMIVSVIPNSNWENYIKRKRNYESVLHTILITGYILPQINYILIHDRNPFEKRDLLDFIKISARTNHTFVIPMKLFYLFEKKFEIVKD